VAEVVAAVLDGGGIVAIVVGIGIALARSVQVLVRRTGGNAYRGLRQDIGRSILLGLEILVAADIIRTVAVEPSIDSLIFLGGIVLIRTFLSFALEAELTGRWPWEQARARQPSPGP
jgi:uncharacterized membrane protein